MSRSDDGLRLFGTAGRLSRYGCAMTGDHHAPVLIDRLVATEPRMPHSRDNQDPPRPDLREAQPDAASAAEDRRFDRWLSRRLHEAYDNVLREALPPDLDRLVQRFSAETASSGSDGGSSSRLDDGMHGGGIDRRRSVPLQLLN
jgi:hypothetical protein